MCILLRLISSFRYAISGSIGGAGAKRNNVHVRVLRMNKKHKELGTKRVREKEREREAKIRKIKTRERNIYIERDR